MSFACLNLDPNLPDHPKLIELESQVGPTALAHLVKLWCWAYKYAPDGDVSKHKNPDYLERQVMGWTGGSGTLFKALLKIGWLERRQRGKLLIHDFFERNQHVISLRKQQSARAKLRWGQREIEGSKTEQLSQVAGSEGDNFMPEGVSEGVRHMPRHTTHECPSPSSPSSPSMPYRTEKISPPTPPRGDGGEISLQVIFEKHTATFGDHPTPTQQSEYQLRLSEFGASASAWNEAFRKAGTAGAKSPEYIFRCLQSRSRRAQIKGYLGGIGKGIE